MKNPTTEDFCRKHNACDDGRAFAWNYETMAECYHALLAGEAGEKSAEWAIWAFSRPGAASEAEQRLFAVWCARQVEHLMTDERSIAALDVAERFAAGDATKDELAAAWDAAWDAARDAARDAAWAAAWAAARDAAWDAAWDSARDAARAAAGDAAGAAAWAAARAARDAAWDAQLNRLREIGNIFEEEGEGE